MGQQYTFIRRAEVLKRTGISRATMYRRIFEGLFPQQSKLSAQLVGWIESEIDQYIIFLRTNPTEVQLRKFIASLRADNAPRVMPTSPPQEKVPRARF